MPYGLGVAEMPSSFLFIKAEVLMRAGVVAACLRVCAVWNGARMRLDDTDGPYCNGVNNTTSRSPFICHFHVHMDGGSQWLSAGRVPGCLFTWQSNLKLMFLCVAFSSKWSKSGGLHRSDTHICVYLEECLVIKHAHEDPDRPVGSFRGFPFQSLCFDPTWVIPMHFVLPSEQIILNCSP